MLQMFSRTVFLFLVDKHIFDTLLVEEKEGKEGGTKGKEERERGEGRRRGREEREGGEGGRRGREDRE